MKSMERRSLCLALSISFGLALPALANPAALSTSARQPEKCLSVPALNAPAADTLKLEEFLLALNGGQEPVPATGCTASTRCWSTGELIRCTGTTPSSCATRTGCLVICDEVEYECPCCGGMGHECL